MSPKLIISGEVAPGFEPVKKLFELQLREGRGENAQLCVYHEGKQVVDLWGTAVGEESYNGDVIQTIWSSTKSVAAIVFACMVDKGLVDYGDKISKHWPEFANNEKGDITVEQLLRHEAGLSKWKLKFNYEDLLTENIKKNTIGKVIEEESCVFPDADDTKREYHGMSRGWILNEIFRRVEPNGRTIGEYLREEIAGPLNLNIHIGAPEDGKLNHNLSCLSTSTTMFHSMLPGFISKKVEVSFSGFLAIGRLFKANSPKEPTPEDRKMFPVKEAEEQDDHPTNIPNVMDNLIMRKGETPSANGACSARGLAKLGQCMLNGGEMDGVRIMSKETCDKMQANPVCTRDALLMGIRTNFTQGGLNVFKAHPKDPPVIGALNSLREGFVGWHGFGGSVFQWHPQADVSFAFVPTQLAWYDFSNIRGGELQQEVIKCIEALKEKQECE